MKLKLIAAVAGLILSAAAQATITPTTVSSDVLLSVWEQGAANNAPDQSFTLDLGMTLNQFVASSNVSATLATLASTDSTWSNFLQTSSSVAGDLQWSVIASGSKEPTRAAIFGSVGVAEDLGGYNFTNNNAVVGNTQVTNYITNLNYSGAPNVNEQVNVNPSAAYYQVNGNLDSFGQAGWVNANSIGAAGVQVAELNNVGGTSATKAALSELPGTLSFVQNGSNYVLSYNVAAVPGAPGFGMALAGLFAVGFMSLRRKHV